MLTLRPLLWPTLAVPFLQCILDDTYTRLLVTILLVSAVAILACLFTPAQRATSSK